MTLWVSSGAIVAVLVALAAVLTRVLAAMVPHLLIRAAVLLWPSSHPRRREIRAEFAVVPANDREAYSAGIVVAGLVDGLGARLSVVGRTWAILRVVSEIVPPAPHAPKGRGGINVIGLLIGVGNFTITFFLDVPVMVAACAVMGTVLVVPQASRVALRLWDQYRALIRRIRLGPQYMVIALLADLERLTVVDLDENVESPRVSWRLG